MTIDTEKNANSVNPAVADRNHETGGAGSVSPTRGEWIKFDEKNNGNNQTNDGSVSNLDSIESPDTTSAASSISVVATIEPSQTVQVVKDPLTEAMTRSPIGRSSASPARLNSSHPVNTSNGSRRGSSQLSQNINTIDIVGDQVVINVDGDNRRQSESNQVNTSLQEIRPARPANAIRPINRGSEPFKNGDVIVTLLPLNQSCAWFTPATFKPELVPEELMAQSLSLTVEDYVGAMQRLTNDVRFNLYMVLYKRVLFAWISLGFVLLLSLLFSGTRGLPLFGGGLLWLIMNALGIFVCMWFKFKLYHLLERCMATINEHLFKSNILLGIDDRGHLSCHKVNLVFVYFDVSQCVQYLSELGDLSGSVPVRESPNPLNFNNLDIDNEDVIIAGVNEGGSAPVTVSRSSKNGEKLLLRYSQRWVKEYVRNRIELSMPLHPDGTATLPPSLPPRHCVGHRCPCQFIEEHLRFKPLTKCSLSELFI